MQSGRNPSRSSRRTGARRKLAATMVVAMFAVGFAMVFRFHPTHVIYLPPAPANAPPGAPGAELPAPAPQAAPAPPQASGMSAAEQRILAAVNAARADHGLSPLIPLAALTAVARAHSRDMALRDYFAHDSPDQGNAEQRIAAAGIHYLLMGENIYTETYPDPQGLTQRAVQGWLHSPPHRKNMLSPSFNFTGIGIARAPGGTSYVTQDFVRQ